MSIGASPSADFPGFGHRDNLCRILQTTCFDAVSPGAQRQVRGRYLTTTRLMRGHDDAVYMQISIVIGLDFFFDGALSRGVRVEAGTSPNSAFLEPYVTFKV